MRWRWPWARLVNGQLLLHEREEAVLERIRAERRLESAKRRVRLAEHKIDLFTAWIEETLEGR